MFLVVPSLKSKQQNNAINIVLIIPTSLEIKVIISENTFGGLVFTTKLPINDMIGDINKFKPKQT